MPHQQPILAFGAEELNELIFNMNSADTGMISLVVQQYLREWRNGQYVPTALHYRAVHRGKTKVHHQTLPDLDWA